MATIVVGGVTLGMAKLGQQLAELGHQVVTQARSAEQLKAAIRDHHPELLITTPWLLGLSDRFDDNVPLPMVYAVSRAEQGKLLQMEIPVPTTAGLLFYPLEKDELHLHVQYALCKGSATGTPTADLDSIVNSLEEAVFSATVDGTVFFCNASGEHLFGSGVHSLITRRLQLLRDVLFLQGTTTATYRITGDSGERWIQERVWLVYDRDHSPLRIDGIAMDVSEVKSMEHALRQEEATVRSVISVIPDLLICLSREGVYLNIWSQEAVEAPVQETNLLGKTLEDALPEDVACRYRHAIELALTTGGVQQFEHRLATLLGAREYEARVVACGTDQVIAVVRDITQAKRNQRQLVRFSQELMEKNRELERVTKQLDDTITKASVFYQKLLPDTLPQVPGWEVATHHQPADRLGGDFFGVKRFGSHVVLYIADISGHSLDGAILALFLRQTIDRSLQAQSDAGVFSPVNAFVDLTECFLAEGFPDDAFVCVTIGILDTDTAVFRYATAGMQTSPLLCGADGTVQRLKSGRLPISNALDLAMIEPRDGICTLDPGSVLFLTTDGLVEQEGPHGVFGEQRLSNLLVTHRALGAQEMSARILQGFWDVNGHTDLQDDVTYLIAKRCISVPTDKGVVP